MSNRLDPNLALCSFGNHLGPICLQCLSADDTRVIEVISKANIKFLTAAFLSSAEFFLKQFFKDSSFMNTIRVSRKVWVKIRPNVLSGSKLFAKLLPNDSIRFQNISGHSYCMV